jgi:hypothetical protein
VVSELVREEEKSVRRQRRRQRRRLTEEDGYEFEKGRYEFEKDRQNAQARTMGLVIGLTVAAFILMCIVAELISFFKKVLSP